ncbi:MAG TPA: M48 family metalloprotease [Verrucomicrobiae bacterium]|nr:M48 family metalloprotease [Verrucomicrobiae bacterium]
MTAFVSSCAGRLILAMVPGQFILPEQAPEVRVILEKICRRAGIPVPGLYVIASAGGYAFTVRGPRGHVIALSQGLFEILNREEFEGLLAHEAAHIVRGDVSRSAIAAAGLALLSRMAAIVRWTVAASGEGGNPDRHPLVLLAEALLFPFRALVRHALVPRNREERADEASLAWSGHPLYLAGALKKMEARNRRFPNPALREDLAHLPPLDPCPGGGFFRLKGTHPRLEARLARLEKAGRYKDAV